MPRIDQVRRGAATLVLLLPALLAFPAGAAPRAAAAAKATAAKLATAPADPLPPALAEIVRTTTLGRARAAVLVEELDSGKPVYSHNADDLLNPASNMKVLTTVAALSVLGPQYVYGTDIFLDSDLEAGVEKGNLYLRGKGDPSLDTGRLFSLVRELRHRGLKEVKGDLIVDDSFFDAEREGPGWEQDYSDSSYMAPSGAVSINHNTVEVHVYPGAAAGLPARVELEPPSDYFEVENHAETAPAGSLQRIRVASLPNGDRQKIVVNARVALDGEGTVFWRRISNPPMYAGQTLKQLLKDQGIKVKGRIRRGVTPWRLKPFYTDASQPLAQLIYRLNKSSQNHMTEQLLKTLGAEGQGSPGSWEKGVRVVEGFLAEKVGIPPGSYVMKNGSGLNDTNRISARQLVAVLRYAFRQELGAPEFLTSLPIAGVDGTTRNRMTGTQAEGRLRAKTGTLSNVTALSGFVTSAGGKRYVFSVLVNDFPGRLSAVLPAVDAIGAAIAANGSKGGPGAAVAGARPPAIDSTTPDDVLRARILTFANLGRAKDGKNARFLRTSLQTERDPALRAVIAESLFLSNRTDSASARAFLDDFDASPAVWGRVRTAGRDLPVQPLLVRTLLEMAAEGSDEALAKLVAVVTLAGEDAPLLEELAGGLAEVGRTAPEELLAALKAATEDGQAAVASLLARGIAAATPPAPVKGVARPVPPHPFVAALQLAAQGGEPRLASFARGFEARLADRLAALAVVPPVPLAVDGPATLASPGGSAPGGG